MLKRLRTPTPKPPHRSRSQLFFAIFLKSLKYSLIFLGFVIFTGFTPIFATIVGKGLEMIGDHYANTINDNSPPTAYTILGGGLQRTEDNGKPLIALNTYSLLRTQTLAKQLTQNPDLPIITSGVESPWIIDGLKHFAKKNHLALPTIVSENASMNTCENAWFSAKLIAFEAEQGVLSPTHHTYLVSDWYHMARARRQFAKAGIKTTPIVAEMPEPLAWNNPKSNRNHARRAFYESIALLRDIIRPQKNCRNANEISIDILKTPRKNPKTF